jgi:hypothetical protein
MTFFNQVLLARNAQGQLESVLARFNKRLVVNFKSGPPQSTVFDIVTSYQYRSSIRTTKNPVEQGVNINDYRIRIIDGVNNNKRSNLVMWGTKHSWREQARVRTFSDACLIAQRYRTQINKLTKKLDISLFVY